MHGPYCACLRASLKRVLAVNRRSISHQTKEESWLAHLRDGYKENADHIAAWGADEKAFFFLAGDVIFRLMRIVIDEVTMCLFFAFYLAH